MIEAAGILFKAGSRVLFVKRGGDGDHWGEWCFPGGKLEPGETPAQAAVRETKEEIEVDADIVGAGVRKLWARRQRDDVDYTTFLQPVSEIFDFQVDGMECEAGCWAPYDNPPLPMHPGARIALEKIGWNELDIAQAIADGDLTSPQEYENIWLFAMRITGTGVSFRSAHKELVYRNPVLYLNQRFLDRCNGLAVSIEHPNGTTLTSDDYQDRVVGAIMLPYLRGDEVWGIAKIHDRPAAEMMRDSRLSTSPSVVFRDMSVNSKVEMDDGSALLIEGIPSLLDHLAICETGVWDKGGEPAGVESVTANDGESTDMTDEEKMAMEAADKSKADAAEMAARKDAERDEKLDKILGYCDSLSSRMDAFEAGSTDRKPMDTPADTEDPQSPEQLVEDRADADEPEVAHLVMPEDRSDDDMPPDDDEDMAARMDAAARRIEDATVRRIAEMERRIPKVLSDAEFAQMSSAQARADKVYAAYGDAAPRPLSGESLLAYRRRLASGLKKHSPNWKDVELGPLNDKVLQIAETQIYNDAMHVALHPIDLPEGELRAIVSVDETGRRITSFAGRPSAWMGTFAANRRRLAGIRNGSR